VVRNNDYWAKRGIAFIKPVPFFGNAAAIVFKTRSFPEVIMVIYFVDLKKIGRLKNKFFSGPI